MSRRRPLRSSSTTDGYQHLLIGAVGAVGVFAIISFTVVGIVTVPGGGEDGEYVVFNSEIKGETVIIEHRRGDLLSADGVSQLYAEVDGEVIASRNVQHDIYAGSQVFPSSTGADQKITLSDLRSATDASSATRVTVHFYCVREGEHEPSHIGHIDMRVGEE